MQYMTSSSLIASIKRRAMVPSSQSTFEDSDFLALASEEIALGLVPLVMSHKEDFFLYSEEVAVEQNKIRYELPYRAIGNKMREISLKDSNGSIYELSRIPIDDVPEYQYSYSYGGRNTYNSMYYVEGNEIVFLSSGNEPNTSLPAGSNLIFTYYLRPNDLVSEDRVGQITNIDTVTGQITLDQYPTVFNVGSEYDLIKARSPHSSLAINKIPTAVNVSGKTITFNPSDLPERLNVGDYVCLAEEAIVPQIPSDMHVILAHRVATRCLEALGDAQGLQLANAKLAEMENKTTQLINNRVEAAPKKVVNRHSALRQGLRRWRY